MTSDALRDLRAEFPALDGGLGFLDWGASGLVPESSRDALKAFVDATAACPSALSVWPWGEHGDGRDGTRTRVRTRLARALGATPADVALVESTTQGLQIAAESIRTNDGDNVVLFELDYLAVALPWTMAARARKLELRFVAARDGVLAVEDVLAKIDEKTRVVAVSTIGWTTGALVDLETLGAECAARGIVLVVDAVQTFPLLPLDPGRLGISYLACGGHKWLCSPFGAGFLYVAPRAAARARPGRFGFLAGRPPAHADWPAWFRAGEAGADETPVFPATGAGFETGGQPSWTGAIGLDRATDLLFRAAPGELAAHARALGTRLLDGLDRLGLRSRTPRDPERRAGMIVVNAPHGREQELAWCDALRKRRLVVTARYAKGVGGVRVCLHGMNLAADVDRLLEAFATLLREA
jgi:selenocysteine lyase/cysteine desulfurase